MQKTSTEPLQTEDEPLDQKFSGHVANPMPYLSGSQTGSRDRTIFNNDRPIFRVPPGFDTVFNIIQVLQLVLSLNGHTSVKDEGTWWQLAAAILKLELLTMLHSYKGAIKGVKKCYRAKDVKEWRCEVAILKGLCILKRIIYVRKKLELAQRQERYEVNSALKCVDDTDDI
ncbi:hypothetical protein Tco_1179136 [Tanacetum coccineum]